MDEWKVTPSKTISKPKPKPKRVFVGNLKFNPDLESKLRDLFAISTIVIHDIEIIKPKQSHITNCFAFVTCDVEMAIKCLHGVSFQGNFIVVKHEKKQRDKNYGRTLDVGITKFGCGWSKPKNRSSSNNNAKKTLKIVPHGVGRKEKGIHGKGEKSDLKYSNEQELSHAIESVAPSELAKGKGASSETDTAIAETAATMTMISANLDSFESKDDTTKAAVVSTWPSLSSTVNNDDVVNSFHTRRKINLSTLMKEYGDYDPDFDKMEVETIEESTNVNEVHESIKSHPTNQYVGNDDVGMLAPNGSVPIHIELVSFGFKYSIPPQARQGWSYSNPISPIDCRDLPRCPHYVSRLSGLSIRVKKTLLSNYYGDENQQNQSDDENQEDKGHMRKCEKDNQQTSSNPIIMKSKEVSDSILKMMEESINDGGHGYAFPLQTSIYIGSEYGRHRSVVLCEHLAQTIRKLLRKNKGGKINQPISIGTRHRDVDKNHRDDEAYGKDLKRQYEAEVKRKKREEWLESRFDNKLSDF